MGPRYIWLRRGVRDPSLGFSALLSEVRRFGLSARSLTPFPPPPPLTLSFAEVTAMGDRRADKRPMEALVLEAERRHEKALRDKAKHE